MASPAWPTVEMYNWTSSAHRWYLPSTHTSYVFMLMLKGNDEKSWDMPHCRGLGLDLLPPPIPTECYKRWRRTTARLCLLLPIPTASPEGHPEGPGQLHHIHPEPSTSHPQARPIPSPYHLLAISRLKSAAEIQLPSQQSPLEREGWRLEKGYPRQSRMTFWEEDAP